MKQRSRDLMFSIFRAKNYSRFPMSCQSDLNQQYCQKCYTFDISINKSIILIDITMLKKYFQDYDSEEDENYEPTAKQNRLYELQHKKKKGGIRDPNLSSHDLYLQIKKEYEEEQNKKQQQKRVQRQTANKLQLANSILNSQSIKPNKRIIFAGKQYILNQETGQLQAVQRKNTIQTVQAQRNDVDIDAMQIRERHISYQYLNHVMQAIYNRSKKINAIGKSKLDWKGFVKQEGIEDKLHYNRKGGVIQNMEFIRNAN